MGISQNPIMDWKGCGEQGTPLEGRAQLHGPDHQGEPKNVINMALLSSHPQGSQASSLTVSSYSHPILNIYFITTATPNPALLRGDVTQRGNIQRDGERSDVKIKVAALAHH